MSDKPESRVPAVPPPSGLELSPARPTPPIEDITQQVPPMRMHEHISLADLSEVTFTMNSDELLFFLTLLNDVHTNLVRDVRNEKLNAASRKEAYEMAHRTELLYNSVFKQLKLFAPDRKDAH